MSTSISRSEDLGRDTRLARAAAEATINRLGYAQPIPRRWLTSAEAAAYLGFASGDVLAVLRAQGRAPPHVGTGKMIRYDIKVLDQWIESQPTKPQAKIDGLARD